MVDFKLLRDMPEPKYVLFALTQDHPSHEPEWQELIVKGHELEGEHGFIARADHTRDKLFPLGVQIREIATGEVVYTADKRRFGDFAINVNERR